MINKINNKAHSRKVFCKEDLSVFCFQKGVDKHDKCGTEHSTVSEDVCRTADLQGMAHVVAA